MDHIYTVLPNLIFYKHPPHDELCDYDDAYGSLFHFNDSFSIQVLYTISNTVIDRN